MGDATVRILDPIELDWGEIVGLRRATMRGIESVLQGVWLFARSRMLLTNERGLAEAQGVVRLWDTAPLEEVAARRMGQARE